jgi:DNA-binding CsgD family transcriptional regulator
LQFMLDKIFREIFDGVGPVTRCQEGDAYFRTTCNLYGLDNVAYLGVNLPTQTNQNYYVHNTYCKDWALRYESEDYVSVDPIVRLGMGSIMPIDWGDIGKLTQAQLKMLGESREFGVGKQGLTFPLHGVHGETAVFSVTADFSQSEWCDFKRSRLREIRIIADFFHQRVLGDSIGPDAVKKPPLTEREVECLRWCAEGKTYDDIGMLLGISARTVRFFLENARHKLDSLNTTHAVAAAMLRGII